MKCPKCKSQNIKEAYIAFTVLPRSSLYFVRCEECGEYETFSSALALAGSAWMFTGRLRA